MDALEVANEILDRRPELVYQWASSSPHLPGFSQWVK